MSKKQVVWEHNLDKSARTHAFLNAHMHAGFFKSCRPACMQPHDLNDDLKKSWQSDVRPFFIWIHEGVCSSSMDPESGFKGVHHQVAALLWWHGPRRWCGPASPTSLPPGAGLRGETLPDRPDWFWNKFTPAASREGGLSELRPYVRGLNICHVLDDSPVMV